MVIAKTASRNVAFKAAKLGESIFVRQSDILMPASSVSLATWGKDIYREYIDPIEEIIEKYREDELQD